MIWFVGCWLLFLEFVFGVLQWVAERQGDKVGRNGVGSGFLCLFDFGGFLFSGFVLD